MLRAGSYVNYRKESKKSLFEDAYVSQHYRLFTYEPSIKLPFLPSYLNLPLYIYIYIIWTIMVKSWCLNNVFMQYTVFDQLKQRLLDGKMKKAGNGSSPESLSAFSAFLLGAISKSIATVLTYPAIRFVNITLPLLKTKQTQYIPHKKQSIRVEILFP